MGRDTFGGFECLKTLYSHFPNTALSWELIFLRALETLLHHFWFAALLLRLKMSF